MSHIDYGYNFGAGVELFKKIQFGASLAKGLKIRRKQLSVFQHQKLQSTE